MLRGKGVCGEDPTSNHLIYPSVAAKPMLPPWGFSEHATGYISGEFGADWRFGACDGKPKNFSEFSLSPCDNTSS
jgi:hypothetical protein